MDQVIQNGLKLIDTIQLLFYAGGVNILGGRESNIKKTAEDLVVTSEEVALEVKADKTKYMVMSGDQNAGQSHSIKTDYSCFEGGEKF
jgi:hypothetical protein